MMLIATRLGFIASRYLVEPYYEGRYVPAHMIAQAYNMNIRALMPALRQLTRAGILRSRVGGSTPGFMFAKDPKELSMLHVFMALEGDVKFECCKELVPDLQCDCEKSGKCGIYTLFNGVIGGVANTLLKVSVADHAKSIGVPLLDR